MAVFHIWVHGKVGSLKGIEMIDETEYFTRKQLENDALDLYLERNEYGINLAILKGGGCNYIVECFDWVEGDEDTAKYIKIFWANSTYDGVRHMYFGDEGYINYPTLPVIANMLMLLAKYENGRHEDGESNDYDYSNMQLLVKG